MSKHRISRLGFSLVELLMVMAIISILTSLAVIGLKSIGGSTGLTSAGDQVGSILAFARQEAISKDTMTAAVLITAPTTGKAAYRTFSIWELVLPSDGSTTTGGNWIQSSKWQTLPSGTIIDNASGVSTYLTPTPLPSTFPSSLSYQGTTLNTASDCAIQIYMPSGRLIPPASSNPFTLQLVEGFYNGTTPTYQHLNPSTGLPANYVQYIFSTATGEPKIVRP